MEVGIDIVQCWIRRERHARKPLPATVGFMSADSRHVRSLLTADRVHDSALGSITRLTADEFPILDRMSIKRLVLEPGSIREPHWHANANELTYCLSRRRCWSRCSTTPTVLGASRSARGEMFHVDSGSLHHIENVGDTAAELHRRLLPRAARGLLAPRLVRRDDAMPCSATPTTCPHRPLPQLPPRHHARRHRPARAAPPVVPDTRRLRQPAQVRRRGPARRRSTTRSASARLARVAVLAGAEAPLDVLAADRDDGMREPHWHPETAELGYVARGHARG